MLNENTLVEVLNNYREFAIFISLGISVIIAILGVLPSIFVTGANIIFFGTIPGFFISLFGEVIGAVVSFWIYRLGFKKGLENISQKNKYLNRLVHSGGMEGVYLVFLTRLLPFMPSGVVTLGAAVSDINIWGFAIATFLGKIPSIALETFISYGFINIQSTKIKIVITLVALLLIAIVLFSKKHYKK